MLRYLKLYKKVCIFAFAESTIFRGAFYLHAGWLLLDALIKIFFFSAVFNQVPTIGGWNFTDTILLVFILGMMWDLAWMTFMNGLLNFIDGYILGTFDFILLKPINPLLYITITGFNPMGFSASRIFILIYLIFFTTFVWQTSGVILALAIFFLGLFVVHGIFSIVSALCFWIIEGDSIFNFTAHFFEGARFPITIFPYTLRLIFTFVLPILIVANYPAMALKGMIGWESVWLVLVIAVIFELLAYYIWNLGIKRYSSASS